MSRAGGGVWFHDIVRPCLATSCTPRYVEVWDVVGSAGGGCGQGAGTDQERCRPGLPGVAAVGPDPLSALRGGGRGWPGASVQATQREPAADPGGHGGRDRRPP